MSNREATQLKEQFVSRSAKVIFGKEHEVELALCCLLARGHLLIEDIPGVGKTTLVKVLARLVGFAPTRIQFTNDLLPADVLGGNIFDSQSGQFRMLKGPIFSSMILADELNRASPRTQSALLQAMEEREVSIEGETHKLPDPFFVIATQNPRLQIGTYPLPESQLDRFLMRISLGYPDGASERKLLQQGLSQVDVKEKIESIEPVLSPTELLRHQNQVGAVAVSDTLLGYVQGLAQETRRNQHEEAEGLSPRGALALVKASRAWAYLQGRSMTLPEDVQAVAVSVMSHRLSSEDLTGQLGRRRAEDVLAQVRAV